jgi:hypothetical protein
MTAPAKPSKIALVLGAQGGVGGRPPPPWSATAGPSAPWCAIPARAGGRA